MKTRYIIGFWAAIALCVQPADAQLQWQFAAPMPTARSNATAAVLNGQIYVLGGIDDQGNALDVVERYDPATDTWHPAPEMRRERAGAASVVFQNRLFVLGGHRFSSDNNSRNVLSDVEVFDPVQNTWESFAGLEEDRDGLTSVVIDGRMFAIGGASDDGLAFETVESYDPIDDEWRLEEGAADSWILDIARVSFATVVVSDAAYSFGGFGSFSGPISQVEKYRSPGGTSILSPFGTPRGGLSAVSVGNAVFLMGGRKQDDAVTRRVDLFVTTSNVWTVSAPMNTAREELASATVSNVVYIFGGRDDRGNILDSAERFGPVSVAVQRPELPADFALGTAHPNPFRARTTIPVEISAQVSSRSVTLVIFDVLGREVTRLIDGSYPVGLHKIEWNGMNSFGNSVASGIYLYRLTQGIHSVSNTLVLTR